ncbi:S-adenosyl-L-methionine-dependent methyltransferase [Trametes punicea]|nr:S-adenosyl-L-methionine-dependent methyltransferase [Trametes punicea]
MSEPTPISLHHREGHNFVEANKTYFNEHADKLEEEHPQARQLGVISVEAMRNAYPAVFNKERTEVLDYACGTVGLISIALRPYVKHIVGVDISQGSVAVYNRRAVELGFSSEMEAVCAVLKGEPGELGDAKFDLITCCASFHHMPSIEETTRVLAYFLKPGGSLLVTDVKAAPDGKVLFPETHHHLVPHKHGLTEEIMRGVFEGAGLTEFEMKDVYTGRWNDQGPELVMFLARGVKPAMNK